MRRLMNAALVVLGLLGGSAALAPVQAAMPNIAVGQGIAATGGMVQTVQYRPRYAPPPRPYYRRGYRPPPRAYRRPYAPRPRYAPPPRPYYRR